MKASSPTSNHLSGIVYQHTDDMGGVFNEHCSPAVCLQVGLYIHSFLMMTHSVHYVIESGGSIHYRFEFFSLDRFIIQWPTGRIAM